MKTLGLEDERIRIRWISASEGKRYADTISELTRDVKKLGPNPVGKLWWV
jgi:F420-non-reducing hydrogenase iron-sulfur subunit